MTRINLNQKVFIRLNTILDHLIHGFGVIVDLFVANTRGDIIPLDQIKSQYFIQNLKMNSLLDSEYFEMLNELGINLRIWNLREKVDEYDGKLNYVCGLGKLVVFYSIIKKMEEVESSQHVLNLLENTAFVKQQIFKTTSSVFNQFKVELQEI